MREILRSIAMELHGIDISECTISESNIADILIENGFMIVNNRDDEVLGWKEYVAIHSELG